MDATSILQIPLDIEDAKQIFREHLTEREQQVYLKITSQMMEDYMEVFNIFDADGSKKVSCTEIEQVMSALGENPSKIKIQQMIERFDFNRDGDIEFEEFLCMLIC